MLLCGLLKLSIFCIVQLIWVKKWKTLLAAYQNDDFLYYENLGFLKSSKTSKVYFSFQTHIFELSALVHAVHAKSHDDPEFLSEVLFMQQLDIQMLVDFGGAPVVYDVRVMLVKFYIHYLDLRVSDFLFIFHAQSWQLLVLVLLNLWGMVIFLQGFRIDG